MKMTISSNIKSQVFGSPSAGHKNLSIEFLKFIAVIFILNGHMFEMYPANISVLATGGTIGNALFFFTSGYTLFLGRLDRFDNWYKRRISRIYPTVIAWAIIAFFVFDHSYTVDAIIQGDGYWFISCIMIYYIVLYCVRKFLMNYKWIVFLFACIVPIIWYLTMENGNIYFMYGGTLFKYFYWLPFMMLGAYMGAGEIKSKPAIKKDGPMLLLCVVLHYAILIIVTKYPIMCKYQPLSLLPLFGVVYYLYNVCNYNTAKSLMNLRIAYIIKLISSLCLEIYVIQLYMFTTKMNSIFPLNIIIVTLYTIIFAYVVHCFGRIIKQTFEKENYRWYEVFKII